MKNYLSNRILGRRIIKTALAVFFTSVICEWLEWPPVFAVITAIVSIEPTVGESIRKGIVRFPASAIGSFYAVLFIYFFENSPITYTLAAFFTIITCYKLGLHAGLLVATLTSVAMVEVIHANLFISFVIRLGTTTVGLLVSTIVNMFILPPNYTKRISMDLHQLLKGTGETLELIVDPLMKNDRNQQKKERILSRFDQMKRSLDKTERLLHYQADEAKYHRLKESTKKLFDQEQKNLTKIRLIHYHIGNLINTPIQSICWSEKECQDIFHLVHSLADYMRHPDHYKASIYRKQVKLLMDQFWASKKPTNDMNTNLFTPEIIVLYELLSIFNLTEDILKIENKVRAT
ncbi:FUSC family protein [Gracilibacillus dipsosauri]|uniref:Aromatic acid exporter family protein n=1 Tax=Gracilibacillus dipsosauri TaxID=178340 RepID=A0A317L349_9BACI|nr:aromatic acid exporter family protein [Gracilibacillus dipsosauri]PWU69318.1 hypothetical protein DLJ74_04870 [Gracilibacillus dipsosauri]